MDKKSSIVLGVFLGLIISVISVFSNFGDKFTLSFSALVVGIVVGYFIESKPLKFAAIAVIIQQTMAIAIMLFSDPDLDVVLSYPVITGLLVVVLIFQILFNVLFGILGAFIGSTVKKYRE